MRSDCFNEGMSEPTEVTQAVLPLPPHDLLTGASLFLDFDGTLVEIAPRPDAVIVPDRLRALVERLVHRLEGRVAVVSGRGADEVAAMLGGSGYAIGGSHGAELRMGDTKKVAPSRPAALDRAQTQMETFASEMPGVLVEAKPLGVGLHYRGAPAAEADCAALAEQLAAETGLVLQRGKMVFELRAPGDKGDAIRRLMAHPNFARGVPVFLGDDVTDEAGFAAARALGGAGILVGPMRDSAATHRLPDVAAVLNWLEDAAK